MLERDLSAAESDRDKSQEVRKTVSDITPSAAGNLSGSEEADRDNLSTDIRVNTLSESTSGLGVVPETDNDTVMNDSNELTGEGSHHGAEGEFNLIDSIDVLQVAIGRSRKLKEHEK